MIDVSVIIPIYNTAKYLEQCIASILNQSLKNIELLCVDDGSTDNSIDILERLKKDDNRIRIFSRDFSSGSAAIPRNIGLDNARGKYIVFFDSDDCMAADMLEKMFVAAELYNSDQVIIDNYLTDESGNIISSSGEINHGYLPVPDVFSYEDIPQKIFQISNTSIWHRMILRDVIEKNGLRCQEGVPILDDVYFAIMSLVLCKRIHIVDEHLMYYRCGRQDAQTTKVEKNVESIVKSVDYTYDRLVELNLFEKVSNSFRNWAIGLMTWWYGAIADRNVAEYMFYRYRDYSFFRWRISDMSESDIYVDNAMYYKRFFMDEFKETIEMVLNSIRKKKHKVIIYGAGKFGKQLYSRLKNENIGEVVLWCDTNYESVQDTRVKSPSEIKSVIYDVILIAIYSSVATDEVMKYLEEMGTDMEKVYTIV